jgi:hypothetical protein
MMGGERLDGCLRIKGRAAGLEAGRFLQVSMPCARSVGMDEVTPLIVEIMWKVRERI